MEAVFDRGQDRRRVVRVWSTPGCELRGDDQRRDAGAGAPLSLHAGGSWAEARGPMPAELVVGDDDHVSRLRSRLDGLDQVDEVVAVGWLA